MNNEINKLEKRKNTTVFYAVLNAFYRKIYIEILFVLPACFFVLFCFLCGFVYRWQTIDNRCEPNNNNSRRRCRRVVVRADQTEPQFTSINGQLRHNGRKEAQRKATLNICQTAKWTFSWLTLTRIPCERHAKSAAMQVTWLTNAAIFSR